ncbi:MAG: hypothetical protein LBD89_00800 [Tannerellaceae bacterium]|jgi:hypothetical protein|nr:hypothetical protein [Tannerellaceae bacterium]
MKHFILCLCIVALCPAVMAGDNLLEKASAAHWLANQVDALGLKLYVYSDYSDSRNHFTQRGVMKSGAGVETPQMNEARTEAYSGTSAIGVNLSLKGDEWAGFYFGNGVQTPGAEPRYDWGELQAGLNLAGATRLVFHARSEGNPTTRVNFFVGGNGSGARYPDSDRRETGYVTLTSEWQRFEIDLRNADLSYISGGFGWVTNYLSNPTSRGEVSLGFLVDDIYYEFATPRPGAVFPASYEPVALDRDGYFINSVAYSYDLAMTVLALAYADRMEQACKVADGLLFALNHDRKFSSSERGLRNGYAPGNPSSFPGWASSSGKSPFARLMGFLDVNSGEWWEDYYSDSFSTGNNAWAILAFLEVWRRSGTTSYLEAACTLADYLHTLKDNTNGGFKGGWEGFDDNQKKAGYISTEHCIDIFSALTQLADELEKNARTPPSGHTPQFYREDAAHAREFVLRMYDASQGLFYTGTQSEGTTPNRDVYPLDVNTWGLMAFHDDPAIDPARILATIESRFAAEGMYDFNDDKDGIWWEGSLQKIIVEKVLGHTAKYAEQLAVANAAAQNNGSITAANRDGLSTGIWLEGVQADGSPKGNEWKYNQRIHTGATAWLALAQLGVNPLEPKRSASALAPPLSAQAQSFVHQGRLYVWGVAGNVPVRIYNLLGQEIARSKSSPAGNDQRSFALPGRGAYIVTAGTEKWKVVY